MGVKVKLLDICRPKQWKTISGAELQAEGFPVYGANGIIGCYSEYNHEQPTLLIGCRGTCGSVCISRARSWINGNAMCLDSLSSDVSLDFLFHQLKNFDFRKVISGTSQPQITQSGLAKIDVVLSSLAEQKRIAGELDRICELKKNAEERLALMDQLVKSRFVEMFGDPKWPTTTIGELSEFLTSGSRGWAKYYSDDGELFITIKNVKNSRITVDDVQHIVPPQGAEADRTRVRAGDLLISITADLGRTGVVTPELASRGAYINQHLTRISLKRDVVDPLYAALYIESPEGKDQIERRNQSAVKAGLNFDSIRSLRLPLPPMKLQREFAAFVESVDKSKAALKETMATMETLYKERLQEYFA